MRAFKFCRYCPPIVFCPQIWKTKKSSKIKGNTLGFLRRSFFPFNALGMPSFNNSVPSLSLALFFFNHNEFRTGWTILESKTCWPNPKIRDHNKCVKKTFLGIEILNKHCFIGFFAGPFFWLDILVSEMVVSENAGLFYVWSTSKYSYLFWRSRFGNISFPNFDLQILDIIVAFLPFMALKVRPKVFPKSLTLVDYN